MADAARVLAREGDAFAAAASEFARAQAALAAAIDGAGETDPLTYYRLRDLAIAAVGLADLIGARLEVDLRAGEDELARAIAMLDGLKSAHVFAFMGSRPVRVVAAGRAAGVVVGALLDAAVGDGYVPRTE